MAHRTVRAAASHEEVVSGSRFIGYVVEVDDVEAAAIHLAGVRAAHPAATHHCWAHRVGPAQRFSDDGEPGGTAGRPMLEVILKRDLDHVSAVVVRYFGGRKLGAGGLVRAYSGTLAKALDAAGVRDVVDVAGVTVRAPFAHTDTVLRLLADAAEKTAPFDLSAPTFDAGGLVVRLSVPEEALAVLSAALREATSGAASLEVDV